MDQDINRLSEGITVLHAMFKQMNEIVIIQGEMVDRIDYNIETALRHVEKGKKHLVEAKAYQESKCASWCIKMQLIAVMILAVLIFIKHTK